MRLKSLEILSAADFGQRNNRTFQRRFLAMFMSQMAPDAPSGSEL
jgi:hypothetical protein